MVGRKRDRTCASIDALDEDVRLREATKAFKEEGKTRCFWTRKYCNFPDPDAVGQFVAHPTTHTQRLHKRGLQQGKLWILGHPVYDLLREYPANRPKSTVYKKGKIRGFIPADTRPDPADKTQLQFAAVSDGPPWVDTWTKLPDSAELVTGVTYVAYEGTSKFLYPDKGPKEPPEELARELASASSPPGLSEGSSPSGSSSSPSGASGVTRRCSPRRSGSD